VAQPLQETMNKTDTNFNR